MISIITQILLTFVAMINKSKYAVKAKKSYGQHFLINENAAEKIAYGLIRAEGIKNVLEIGPGKGVLTKYLVRQKINFKAVEADRDMVAYLEEHYPVMRNRIIFLDFLKLDLSRVFEGEPFYLIGNYPYNISSQIIFKLLKHKNLVPEMIGMFQREVADRIIAPHGSKTYGVLSVLTQAFYEGKRFMKVSPGSFSPPPKVDSAVIRLTRKENFELPCSEQLFRAVVKTSFGQRRKMMRNTLKALVDDTDILESELLTKRPEQLSVEEFIDLTVLIEKSKNNNNESGD